MGIGCPSGGCSVIMGLVVSLDSFEIICSNLERHYFCFVTDSFSISYFSIQQEFISTYFFNGEDVVFFSLLFSDIVPSHYNFITFEI